MSTDSMSPVAVDPPVTEEPPNEQRSALRDELAACRLACRIESLPLFARLYRSAFKSGYGPGLSKRLQLASRLTYYSLERLFLMKRQCAHAVIRVQDHDRSITFDCRNRQFNVLYFEKYRRGYELPTAGAIQHFLRHGGVLYDIGSNWGYFTLLACATRERSVTAHAFEPWPSSYRDLLSIVEQAGLNDRVVCHHCAVGTSSEAVAMRSGRHSGLARVVSGEQRGVSVKQIRLDDLDIEAPTVMKIDVEGGELGVIQGALRKIRVSHPAIAFENDLHSGTDALQTLTLLEAEGYRLLLPVAQMKSPNDGSLSLTCDYDQPGSGRQFTGVLYHPISSDTRRLHPTYANMLAVHESRMDEVKDRLIH